MEDISLHILDIVENSIAAQADQIEIIISEDEKKDVLSLEIIDNGIGMDDETVKKALDPFYTSKKVRRFGFGLPLLSEAAKAANGHLSITSEKGKGTRIKADFQYSHVDRKPMGDMAQTITTLVIGNPEIDLIYVHKKDSCKYRFDTREIKSQLNQIPLNSSVGIRLIRENLKKDTEKIKNPTP